MVAENPLPSADRSNVDKVLSALHASDKKDISQIVAATDLTESQVRGVLNSPSVKRMTKRYKSQGNNTTFALAETESIATKSNGKPSTAKAILQVLEKSPNGLTSRAIADDVLPMIDTNAKSPRNVVGAALSHLKDRGKVMFNERTSLYQRAREK